MQIFLDKIKKPRNRKPHNGKPRKTRDYCIHVNEIFKNCIIYVKSYNCSDIGNVLNVQQYPSSVYLTSKRSVQSSYLMPNQ